MRNAAVLVAGVDDAGGLQTDETVVVTVEPDVVGAVFVRGGGLELFGRPGRRASEDAACVFFYVVEVVGWDIDGTLVEYDVVGGVVGVAYGSKEAVDAAVKHDVEGAEMDAAFMHDGQSDQRKRRKEFEQEDRSDNLREMERLVTQRLPGLRDDSRGDAVFL